MLNSPSFGWFFTSQVGQDFFHQQYLLFKIGWCSTRTCWFSAYSWSYTSGCGGIPEHVCARHWLYDIIDIKDIPVIPKTTFLLRIFNSQIQATIMFGLAGTWFNSIQFDSIDQRDDYIKWLEMSTIHSSNTHGCFRKQGYPQIINFNRGFHYKPSILGYPYFWKRPHGFLPKKNEAHTSNGSIVKFTWLHRDFVLASQVASTKPLWKPHSFNPRVNYMRKSNWEHFPMVNNGGNPPPKSLK